MALNKFQRHVQRERTQTQSQYPFAKLIPTHAHTQKQHEHIWHPCLSPRRLAITSRSRPRYCDLRYAPALLISSDNRCFYAAAASLVYFLRRAADVSTRLFIIILYVTIFYDRYIIVSRHYSDSFKDWWWVLLYYKRITYLPRKASFYLFGFIFLR